MKLPALLTAVLLTAALTLPAAPAGAATPPAHPRATTLLASSRYIVFRQRTTRTNLRPEFLAGGSIYAADARGRRQALPGFTNTTQFLFLTGSVLVQAQNAVHSNSDLQTVRWRDLRDRTTGVVRNGAGGVLVAAAPDGWIMQRSTDEDGTYGSPQRLTYVHLDGRRVDLGEPFPEGQSFGLAVSDTGIIATPATSDEAHFASRVRWLPWDGAAAWRTLLTTRVSESVSCAPSSSRYAACTIAPADTFRGPTRNGIVALDGGGARWVQTRHPHACAAVRTATLGSSLLAIETSDAGACTKGALYRFGWSGVLIRGAAHRYSSTSLRVGLGGRRTAPGRIIVSSLDQRHIDTLTGVTRAPKVLVRVRGASAESASGGRAG